MPDLVWLAEAGRASIEVLWLPVALWTVAALVTEAGVRIGRAGAPLALPVRGAVLAALPLAVVVPAALRAMAPGVALAVADATPDVFWLPGIDVGGPAPEIVAAGPSAPHIGLGVLVVAAGLLAAVRLLQFAQAVVVARRARLGLPVAAPKAVEAVAGACRRLGVTRPVGTVEAPTGAAPFTLGWRRPVVALPPDLSPEAREVAAAHEVAHVRRADYAWHAAQRAVTAVFAAHPLVWVLGRGLDLDRERAADAAVLAACPDRRRAYADLLFSYAALPAPPLALGAMGGASTLKSRLDAMTHPLSPARARAHARLGRIVGLLALVVVAGLAATTAPPPPTATASPLAAPDALAHLIDRVDFWRGDDGSRMTVQLTPTATHDDAVAVLDAADAGEAGTVPVDMEVRYASGAVRRDIRLRDGQTVLGDFPLGRRTTGPVRDAQARRDTTDVYEIVDEMPRLIGGLEGLAERLVYPELQKRAGVEGRAVLQFIVGADGVPEAAQVMRSAGNDGLDRAAMAAVAEARFTPGRQDGRAVRVRFALPVTFRLPTGDAATDRRVREVRPDPQGEDGVYGIVDEMPQLIGGLEGVQERLVYPQVAKDAGIEGQVVVQFIVDEQGQVQDAVVLRSPNDLLSQAALQAVRGSRFEPGRTGGQAVKVRFAVPITFRLPTEGGEDQGSARPVPDRVFYSGVDLSRLTPASRAAFEQGLSAFQGTWVGDVEMTYLIAPDGTTRRFRVESGPPELHDAVVGLARQIVLRDGARPGAPVEGRLRVWSAGG